MSIPASVALLGFGEVGAVLAHDLRDRGSVLSAWDVKFIEPESAGLATAAAEACVRVARDAVDAVRDAGLVISAVTAAQAEAAARAAADGLQPDAFFLDLNSASPTAKMRAAEIVNKTGARYVEAAVMSPIAPKRSATTMLFGGPHAHAFLPAAHALGFSGASMFSPDYGPAAAAKLCRSVVIKGLEALLLEALLAARHYGVAEPVVRSLDDLLPGAAWPQLSHYMISRTLAHGVRRAEEMQEAAFTVEQAGLTPLMSQASAAWQAWAARRAEALGPGDLTGLLDSIAAQAAAGLRP